MWEYSRKVGDCNGSCVWEIFNYFKFILLTNRISVFSTEAQGEQYISITRRTRAPFRDYSSYSGAVPLDSLSPLSGTAPVK
jgi:hypothetical protein